MGKCLQIGFGIAIVISVKKRKREETYDYGN